MYMFYVHQWRSDLTWLNISGNHCEHTVDQCATNPCGINATCVSLPPGVLNNYSLPYDCSNCPVGQNLVYGKCQDIGQNLIIYFY